MKILYAAPDIPLTPDGYGGASALAFSHLELLAHSGHTLALALLPGWNEEQFEKYLRQQPERWTQVQSWVASCERLAAAAPENGGGHIGRLVDALRGRAYLACADGDARAASLRKKSVSPERTC